MNNRFDKDNFMDWLKEEFPGVIDAHWNWELVKNIIDYATNNIVNKDEFLNFISNILPEVKFLEVANFYCEL